VVNGRYRHGQQRFDVADRDRRRRVGIPDGTKSETKPRQTMAMLARAFEAKVPFSWITADEAYGQVKYLLLWLEATTPHMCWPPRSTTPRATTSGTKLEPTS
jgi:hypothetical protein